MSYQTLFAEYIDQKVFTNDLGLKFTFNENVNFGNEIWNEAKKWMQLFTDLSLVKGDRIVLHLEESPVFLAVLFAAIRFGLCTALLSHKAPSDNILDFTDARLIISQSANSEACIKLGTTTFPPKITIAKTKLREAKFPPNKEMMFLLKSSGTTSEGRWSALSFRSVWAVIDSHIPEMQTDLPIKQISVLPWTHCFGLVLDLLPTFFTKTTELFRSDDYGRAIPKLIEQIKTVQACRFNGVPYHFAGMMEYLTKGSYSILSDISSGIIGGAPISMRLAAWLNGSKVRVGYGQSEASPGITLGKIGEFKESGLGYAISCETKIDGKGQLLFKGKNQFMGYWKDSGLESVTNHWHNTGDIVSIDSTGFHTFIGRIDARVKLPNGRESWKDATMP